MSQLFKYKNMMLTADKIRELKAKENKQTQGATTDENEIKRGIVVNDTNTQIEEKKTVKKPAKRRNVKK